MIRSHTNAILALALREIKIEAILKVRIASMLAGDVSKMFSTGTWISLPRWVHASSSLADEPHAWSRSELNIGDAQGIASPAPRPRHGPFHRLLLPRVGVQR